MAVHKLSDKPLEAELSTRVLEFNMLEAAKAGPGEYAEGELNITDQNGNTVTRSVTVVPNSIEDLDGESFRLTDSASKALMQMEGEGGNVRVIAMVANTKLCIGKIILSVA